MGDNAWAVALASIALLGTCIAFLIWLIKLMLGDGKEILQNLASNIQNNTKATKAADKYLKDRNGRDSEFHKETLIALQAIPKKMQDIADTQAEAIVKALKKQPTQVQEQKVLHQTVKRQENL